MKKRIFLLLLLSFSGIASFGRPLSLAAEGDLPTSLEVGDSVNIPSKTLTYLDESKTAEVLITSPSGGVYTGNRLTIEEPGVYQVTYRAYFGSHEEKETHEIRVDYRARDLFECNDYVTVKSGSFSYDESLSGVKATFKNNGVLSYRKPVDLAKLGTDTPLVSFIIDPSAIAAADFSTFNINIVDAYDKNNYVAINCVDSGTVNTAGEGMYVKAGAVGQTLYGYETDTNRHSNPSFGSSIHSSFRAMSGSGEYHAAEFYFDYSSLDLYGYPNFISAPKRRKIVGLASKADHPTDPFAGFKTSLAYLSFEAKNFSSGSGDVVFTSIAGTSLDEDKYLDEKAPEIKVDLAGNLVAPDAALYRPYKVFEASSFDEFDADVETDCKIYYLPGDGKRIDVEIGDGYFLPRYIGDYQIVYAAKDRFLNENTLTISLSCLRESKPLLGVLSLNKLETTVYSSVSVPSFEDFVVSGGSGLISKNRLLIDPDGILSSLDSETFVPTKIGTYRVRYQAFDYLGQAVICDLKVTVKNLTSPIFLNEAKLPAAFVQGEKATLPIVQAKTAGETSPVDCPVDIYVNGSKIDGNSFVPTGGEVNIAYVASSLRQEYNVPVVDLAQGSKQENCLYGKGSSSVSENEVIFTATEEGDVTFVRSLKPSELILKFALPDTNEGETMKIKLSDGDNAVSLTVKKEGSGYSLATSSSNSELTLDGDGSIYLAYDNIERKISDGSGYDILSLNFDDDGNSFVGFTNDITLSFHLNAGSSIALNKINNQAFGLRGRSSPLDEIGPELSLPSMPAVKQKMGSSVELPIVKTYDVLNEIASFNLTLIRPDKTQVALDPSVKNTITFDQYGSYRLEYVASDIKGNSSKTIRLFSVYETNPPELSVTSSLKDSYLVGDEIALPDYKISDDSSDYVVTFILLTPDYERIMLLKDESGSITYYLDKDDYSSYRVSSTSFKLKKDGTYTLLIRARDRFYNVTSKEISFTVKGGE